jgi:hypothetical protein
VGFCSIKQLDATYGAVVPPLVSIVEIAGSKV